MAKKKRPVAECTDCNKKSWAVESINKKCRAVVGGKKCQGIFQRMLRDSDWTECRECNATGAKKSGICIPCSGDGWISIRTE